MRTNNAIYVGDRTLEPPEDVVMIRCTHCHKSAYSLEWRKNNGSCPRCHEAYAGPEIDED